MGEATVAVLNVRSLCQCQRQQEWCVGFNVVVRGEKPDSIHVDIYATVDTK